MLLASAILVGLASASDHRLTDEDRQRLETSEDSIYAKTNSAEYHQFVVVGSFADDAQLQVVHDSTVIDFQHFLALVVLIAFFIAGVVIAVMIGIYCCRLLLFSKETPATAMSSSRESSASPPSYGSLNSYKYDPYGERKMAYSCQMYHYEMQKQRIMAEERAKKDDQVQTSEDQVFDDDDDEIVVYECPGLASTDELEVKNPLFDEELLNSLHAVEDGVPDDDHSQVDDSRCSSAAAVADADEPSPSNPDDLQISTPNHCYNSDAASSDSAIASDRTFSE